MQAENLICFRYGWKLVKSKILWKSKNICGKFIFPFDFMHAEHTCLRAYVKWQNLIYLIITTVFEFFCYGKCLLFPLVHTQTFGDFSTNRESRLVARGRVDRVKLLFSCVLLWPQPFLTEPSEYALVVGFMNVSLMFGEQKLGVFVCFWGFKTLGCFQSQSASWKTVWQFYFRQLRYIRFCQLTYIYGTFQVRF